jgi:hypothetical protein
VRGYSRKKVRKAFNFRREQMWKGRTVHEYNPRIEETGPRIRKTIETLSIRQGMTDIPLSKSTVIFELEMCPERVEKSSILTGLVVFLEHMGPFDGLDIFFGFEEGVVK